MLYCCHVDVDIMRLGCFIFSKEIKGITDVVPFYDKTCITIASLALKIFRTKFLQKEVIGQIPANDFM